VDNSHRKFNIPIFIAVCSANSHKQPYFIAAVFSFGTATAKDIQTILITRFFSGLFGSAPVVITGGVMADIWAPHQLGNAIVAYGVTIVGGPTLGPIIGSALCSSHLGWRWTEYLTGIVMMAQLAVNLLVIDESYAPTLLVRKAHKMRIETQDWALHAKVSARAGACVSHSEAYSAVA
jgi:MFS family permease